MRRVGNAAERAAWKQLRDRRCLGLKFRRQQVIEGFIVDFYCEARRLIVEIDGGVHDDPTRRLLDEDRTAAIQRRGVRVLRVRDRDVLEGRLVEKITSHLAARSETHSS